MTVEEAIKHLQFSKKSYQNLIDNDTRSGDAIGKDIHGMWSADTSLVKAYQTMIDTMDMAIASLETWNKIKQEINDLFSKPACYMPNYDAYKMFLEIIDKHLQEVEE